MKDPDKSKQNNNPVAGTKTVTFFLYFLANDCVLKK